MLASVASQQLVAETKFAHALGVGNLLPVNNNRCFLDLSVVTTVSVIAPDDTDSVAEPSAKPPIAFGLFNRCTSTQLYCSIVAVSSAYKNVFVDMELLKVKNSVLGVTDENPNHHLFKIRNVTRELPDLSGLPQYFSAFAEPSVRPLLQAVVDELVGRSVGNENFELTRNLTVDLYDASEGVDATQDKLWRDFAGFIVTDRNRYAHLEISKKKFLEVVCEMGGAADKPSTTVNGVPYRVETLTRDNTGHCIDYDSNVALAINRQDYLDYLFQIYGFYIKRDTKFGFAWIQYNRMNSLAPIQNMSQKLNGVVALDARGEVRGYIISLGTHVLQCYADEPQIARRLMQEHVVSMDDTTLSLFVRIDDQDTGGLGDALAQAATRARRVRRFHTRVALTNINWAKIFALNIGLLLTKCHAAMHPTTHDVHNDDFIVDESLDDIFGIDDVIKLLTQIRDEALVEENTESGLTVTTLEISTLIRATIFALRVQLHELAMVWQYSTRFQQRYIQFFKSVNFSRPDMRQTANEESSSQLDATMVASDDREIEQYRTKNEPPWNNEDENELWIEPYIDKNNSGRNENEDLTRIEPNNSREIAMPIFNLTRQGSLNDSKMNNNNNTSLNSADIKY